MLKVQNTVEREIAIASIVSDDYLSKMREVYKPKLILSDFARRVVGWCVDYHEKYGKAPGKHITELFHHHVRKGDVDDAMEEMIGKFLAGLSTQYEDKAELNVPYLLDVTEKHFKDRSLLNLSEDLQALVSEGKTDEASVAVGKFHLPERKEGHIVEPFADKEVAKQAFQEKAEPLFMMRGALGRMINHHLTRDAFIAIMGPEKRGKSFWLLEFAFVAYRQRRNVAFFSCGDMSQNQATRRLCVRSAKLPMWRKHVGPIKIPVEIVQSDRDDDDQPIKGHEVVYQEENFEKSINLRESWMAMKNLSTDAPGKFKLATYATDTLRVSDIENQLDLWESQEGFVPDVIVVDYADILAPEKTGEREFRHQENSKWKSLRRVSQERRCLVITATQADGDSYDQETLSMKNYSEDKRKYAHVTGLFALNQTPEEKKAGVMRLGWLVLREDEFDTRDMVYVLQCLRLGLPHVRSFYLRDINEKQ